MLGKYLVRLKCKVFCFSLLSIAAAAETPRHPDNIADGWTFAVSGDSRNCGNVVMPAIASAVRSSGAAFYWHLGDYRAIYKFDEDYVVEPNIKRDGKDPTISGYLSTAWDDFVSHQLSPFGDIPVYLAAGNHETIPPKTHDDYVKKFTDWFDKPELRTQRVKDNPMAVAPSSHYHWIKGSVDFINLDNSVRDTFDQAQLDWFVSIVLRDEVDSSIRTIVVGMHEALPDSVSAGHSMCGSSDGVVSGRFVYKALVHAQEAAHKNVYVLASHSHFYLENAYNTAYWNDPKNGGAVLPGWIVGTAGAVRYKLPTGLPPGTDAKEHTYGYMTGTVAADGTIAFAFHPLDEDVLKRARSADYTDDFVHTCFKDNPPVGDMSPDRSVDPCHENQP